MSLHRNPTQANGVIRQVAQDHPLRPPGCDVLILAHAFPPENLVGALRPFRLAKYLPQFGFPCRVITASRQPEPPPPNVHHVADRIQESSAVSMRCLRLAQYALLRLIYPDGVGHSLSWIPPARAKAEALLSGAPAGIVLSTFPPLATHLSALLLKRRYRESLIWVADFRDPLSNNPAESGPGAFWNARIEPQIFAQADWLVANTDAAADRWRAKYPQWAHKVSYLWNGFDPEEEIGPLPLPQRNHKVMAHVGEIYHGRHPHALLASIARLLKNGRLNPAAFQLCLVGALERASIPDVTLLDSLIQRGVVVNTAPVASLGESYQIMAQADSLLLIDWAGARAGLQVPYKLFVYLRIGRPVLAITTRNSPVDRILARSGVPYECLYPEDTPEETDAKVLRFHRLPSEPARASAWFYQEFDGRRQAGALASILEDLARARQSRLARK